MKKENQPKQRKRWKKVLLIILCIVLVLLLAGFLILRSIFMQPSIPAATGDDRTIVETANGKIRGSLTDSVYQYLGIPYQRRRNALRRQRLYSRGAACWTRMPSGRCPRRAGCWECPPEIRMARTTTVRT